MIVRTRWFGLALLAGTILPACAGLPPSSPPVPRTFHLTETPTPAGGLRVRAKADTVPATTSDVMLTVTGTGGFAWSGMLNDSNWSLDLDELPVGALKVRALAFGATGGPMAGARAQGTVTAGQRLDVVLSFPEDADLTAAIATEIGVAGPAQGTPAAGGGPVLPAPATGPASPAGGAAAGGGGGGTVSSGSPGIPSQTVDTVISVQDGPAAVPTAVP